MIITVTYVFIIIIKFFNYGLAFCSADTKQLESSLDDDKNNVSSDESDDEGWDYVKGAGNANNTSKSNNRVDNASAEVCKPEIGRFFGICQYLVIIRAALLSL